MFLAGIGHTADATIAPVVYKDVTRTQRFTYVSQATELPNQPTVQRLDAPGETKIA